MKPIGDYLTTIPLHQKEGRSWSPVEHEDLARWAIAMDDLLAACKALIDNRAWESTDDPAWGLVRAVIAKAERKDHETTT